MGTLKYNLTLVRGLHFELTDTWEDKDYDVSFIEKKDDGTRVEIYSTKLRKGHWAKINRRYLSNIVIEIWDKIDPIAHVLKETISVKDQLKGKRVFITFESKSLGDTVAWIPYCLEFKKTYECDVIVSSFINEMFESVYPELEFVPRGTVVNNIVAMFELGWWYHDDFEPVYPGIIPLQQAATNILGLPFEEIKPRIAYTPKKRPIKEKYIAISTRSTSQAKHWDYWQELINYLITQGYKVVEVSREGCDAQGLVEVKDRSSENLMNLIYHSEFFIGLGSGSSWLAWVLNKQVVMICNFSEEGHEFTSNCIRITDKSICHGCWNKEMFKFDKGNWYWCPEHEHTDRQFECHKLLTADRVIEEIKKAYLL